MLLAPCTASGQAIEAWLDGEHATGNWGGLRDTLVDQGITIDAGYTADLLTLARGGESEGEGWSYAGIFGVLVDFDLEKLAGLPGASIFVSAAWSSGQDLSERNVGNIFPVAEAFTGQSVRLSNLYYQQKLFEDAVTFKIGRLTTEQDFLSSEIYGNYVSGGINGTPFAIPDSNPGFTTIPFVQWGTVLAWEPTEQVRTAIGVYNGNDAVNDDKEHGTDFVLDPDDNMLIIGEIGYSWHDIEGEDGLPGVVKFGGLYETGDRSDLPDGERTRKGNTGFYASIEQKVFREADDPAQGLTPWAVVTYQPRQSVNQIPVFFGAGLVYTGLIPTRDEDNAAIGFFYGRVSRDIQGAGSEKVLELNYTLQVTKWFYIRPDLQFVFDPAGDSDISNAIVAGGEIGITF